MLWTAEQYARAAGLPLRTARWRLAAWFARAGAVRVVRDTHGDDGRPLLRPRYLLDVASWRAATGIALAA